MDSITSKPGGSGYPSIPTTSQTPSKSDSSIRPDTNRKMHDEMHLQKSKDMKSRQIRLNEANRQRDVYNQIFSTKKYIKFYTIGATDPNQNLSAINVIRANNDLKRALKGAKPKNVQEIRNGTLTIEVQSEEEGKNLEGLTTLDGIPVKASEHSFLNQTKGTIYYRNRCELTEKEIMDELAPLKVTNVYRVTKKVSNEIMKTNIYILTFNLCELPEEVSIGYHKCRVREYIPQARRCFNCQDFLHSGKNCRREVAICVNCGQEAHGPTCNRPACCKNCKGNHPASSKDCYYYKLATEIVILQTKEKINYREAKYRVLKYLPKPENLYSNAVKNTKPTINKTSKKPERTNNETTSNTKEPNKERKRTHSENSSDPETKAPKKSNTPGASISSSISPPVSIKSQEAAPLPTHPNKNAANLLLKAPPAARRAAINANRKISGCQSSVEIMDDDPQPSSQRSRSSSKNRSKIFDT